MKRREEMTFFERFYLIEVIRGLIVTFSKLGRNFIVVVFGTKRQMGVNMATIMYPNERRAYPVRYRGRHRLTLHSNGDIKCTSCFLCATACPAKCIYIEPAEHVDSNIEKFPHRYEIDTLLCIYCGYCVEACPVDAIRMDTGLHPEVYPPDPRMYIEDKELLMSRSRKLQDFGSDVLYKMHMEKMQKIEQHPFEPIKFDL